MLPHTMSSRIQYKYNHCLILRLKALSFSSETKFCSVRFDGSCSFIRLLNQPQIWNFLAGFLEISSHNLEFLPNLCGNTGFFKTAVAPRDFCKKKYNRFEIAYGRFYNILKRDKINIETQKGNIQAHEYLEHLR